MSVLIEAVSVVIKRDSIRTKFSGGWSSFQSIVFSQYSTCADSNLATVSFLAASDAFSYVRFLEEMDFIYLQDFAIADQTQGLKDTCDWCYITDFKLYNNPAMAVTGCKAEGGKERKLYVPPGWKFEGSLSQHCTYQDTDEVNTGKVMRKGKRLSITEASPDAEIYNRGFVIGGKILKRFSKGTWDPPLDVEEEPDLSTERIKSTNPEQTQ